jgi:Fuc2NAc and GlcNAc transferase
LLLSIACAVAFAMTNGARSYALKHRLIDAPSPRSSHVTPTPHGGGLAIAVTFLGSTLLLFVIGAVPSSPFMALFGGGAIVAAIGFWDDHTPVHASLRLTAQLAASAWALYWLSGIPPLPILSWVWEPGWLGHFVALLALVWLINLYNFMDGIDGIAALEALTIAAAASLIMSADGPDEIILWLGLLGTATLGFLPWNWAPARIFMGDVGSGFLGFAFAVFALYTAHIKAVTLWSWIILLGVFIVDATVTLVRRLIRGDRWYLAHRSHAYQHAAMHWSSHKKVALAVFVINTVWLTPLAWFVNIRPRWGIVVTCVALMPLLVLALVLGAGLPTRAARTTP